MARGRVPARVSAAARAELGDERAGAGRGARPARRAGGEADADLAEGPVEDVRAVPGRAHPGAHDLPRRGVAAGAPREVLAQRPAVYAAQVARVADPLLHRRPAGRDVGEEALAHHEARVAP